MSRSKTGIVVVGVIATGAVAWTQTKGDLSCPATVVLGEVSYTPAEASEEITSGDELGTGEERGCG
jgi:type IV secretory pathway VirB2 component (pilin)